ncbi:Tn3 transposase DDE domain protein [Bacillus cereus]|nr:Tn3 transposase DDE domain protein [Bacillus cereus]
MMSIKMGCIHPSTILNKLSAYSKKNKLYQVFRELGCAIRTLFLLKYLSDEMELLREITGKDNGKLQNAII